MIFFDYIAHMGHNASFDDFETLVKKWHEFKTPPQRVTFETAQ